MMEARLSLSTSQPSTSKMKNKISLHEKEKYNFQAIILNSIDENTFVPVSSTDGHGKTCSAANICFNVLHCFFFGFAVWEEELLLEPLNELADTFVCDVLELGMTYECWNQMQVSGLSSNLKKLSF